MVIISWRNSSINTDIQSINLIFSKFIEIGFADLLELKKTPASLCRKTGG